jgi:hypothetical protein
MCRTRHCTTDKSLLNNVVVEPSGSLVVEGGGTDAFVPPVVLGPVPVLVGCPKVVAGVCVVRVAKQRRACTNNKGEAI